MELSQGSNPFHSRDQFSRNNHDVSNFSLERFLQYKNITQNTSLTQAINCTQTQTTQVQGLRTHTLHIEQLLMLQDFLYPIYPVSRLINNPNLTKSLQSLSHPGNCSLKIKNIIPDPVRRVRMTKSSAQSHSFKVMLLNPRTPAHNSSFIPRTSQLWNTLPFTTR